MGALLPDYRGVFLRGHGSVTSGHYGAVVHQSADLGQLQGDAIRDIQGDFGVRQSDHGIFDYRTDSGPFQSYTNTATCNIRSNAETGGSDTTPTRRDVSFAAHRAVPTGNENRPVNRAVVYLVRAR